MVGNCTFIFINNNVSQGMTFASPYQNICHDQKVFADKIQLLIKNLIKKKDVHKL